MHIFTKALAVTAAMSLLTSCASIIEGSSDDVNINAPTPMHCNATNERGTWTGMAPGSVHVKKSRTDLKVNCADSAGGTAGSTVISDVEPWVFGNILIGGIVGLGVDWITGAAYDYPKDTTVVPTVATPAVSYMPTPAPVVPPEPVGAPLEPVMAPAPAPMAAPAPVVPAPTMAPAAPGSANQPTSSGTLMYYPPAQPQPQQGTIAPLPFGGPTPAPSY